MSVLPEKIDKRSFEPAYIQIANIIRQQIANGLFRQGNRLPSESELRKAYGVSPMTIRRAVNILLDQGIVNTIQGSGTFVRPIALDTVVFRLKEFNRIFQDTSLPRVKLLDVKIVRADDVTAQKLRIQTGDRTIFLRRLILVEREPVLYHREYLTYDPNKPVVEAEMEVTSLHGLFHNTGESNLKRGKLSVEATILDKDVATLLNAPEGLPSFKLEHVFYDYNDNLISWGKFICRGDRFSFISDIGFSDV